MSETELRRLDAEIATKVFGRVGLGYYGPTRANARHTDSERFDTPEEALEAYKRFWPAPPPPGHASWMDVVPISLCSWQEGWGPVVVDEYSEDISAAWLVLDEMRRHAGDCLVSVVRLPRGEGWGCRIGKTAAPTHPTAPLAICKAALKWFAEREGQLRC